MKGLYAAEGVLTRPRVPWTLASQDVALGLRRLRSKSSRSATSRAGYARFAQVFGKVRDTFGEKVRFVFKHLPVPGRSPSMPPKRLRARQCASAGSGRITMRSWRSPDTRVGPLKQIAGDVGLDRRALMRV